MADDLNTYEIEVLEMLAGTRRGTWGSWVSACLETLQERGLCTPGPKYKITPDGTIALRALQNKDQDHG